MVVSGLALAGAGLAWRLQAGGGIDRATLRDKRAVSYGVQRTTNVMMMVGVIGAGFGVYGWLG